ncbi:MAG: cation:dicarboxylase symporter family transporter [Candidatus Eisenbacteria bacterium]|nr:cation:dicarboxylase symporter family transporter [Candidatus Eisenbacteria bacterium]
MRGWPRLSLTQWILVALVAGAAFGYADPAHAVQVGWVRDIFLHLIKSIIAPLVFSTVVVGIAGGGEPKQVGRMGWKSLLYFEVVTTIALFLGLAVVNLIKPGVGIQLAGDPGVLGKVAENHPKTLIETLVHIFPTSIFDALARGDVLQIVAFSVIFGLALMAVGEKGRPVVAFCESLAQVMFRFTEYVMYAAPLGVGAAMAATIGHQGLDVLRNLGMLIGSLYLALVIFVVVVFGAVAAIIRLPIVPFMKAIREPFALAFVTTSSESALPKAMEAMERFGVPRRIVGFVIPAGYSFNLDGTTLYLAMASVFIAQAVGSTVPGFTFPLSQQLAMMVTLMITSKGVAAVPRASLVILLATVNTFLPTPYGAIGVAMIFGVDELMDMARTSVNLLGNCLASVVIARWEGVFDDEAHRA